MTLVYRVQKTCGTGLYRGSDHANMVLEETSTRHPLPHKDDALVRSLGEESYVGKLFAFTSLEQLKFWIYRDEDRRAIAREGLYVSVISATEVYAGDTQCVFSGDCREVDRMCLEKI